MRKMTGWGALAATLLLSGCSGDGEVAAQTVTETVTATVTATAEPAEATVTVEAAPTPTASETTSAPPSPTAPESDEVTAGEDMGGAIRLIDQGLSFQEDGRFAYWGATLVNTGPTRHGWVVNARLFDEEGSLLDDGEQDISTLRKGQTFHVGGTFLDGVMHADHVEIDVRWEDNYTDLDQPRGEVTMSGELLIEGGAADRIRFDIKNDTTSTMSDGAEVCYVMRDGSGQNMGGGCEYAGPVGAGESTQALIDAPRVPADASWTVDLAIAYDEFNFER